MSNDLLKNAMTSLVHVLRELLTNMEQEQHAILVQDAPAFQIIMNKRTPLLNSMQDFRSTMVFEIEKLREDRPDIKEIESEQDRLLTLAQLTGVENIELLTLRDQILALTSQMEKQNGCNNYLLGNQANDSSKDKYSHNYKPGRRRNIPQPQKSPARPKSLLKTIPQGQD